MMISGHFIVLAHRQNFVRQSEVPVYRHPGFPALGRKVGRIELLCPPSRFPQQWMRFPPGDDDSAVTGSVVPINTEKSQFPRMPKCASWSYRLFSCGIGLKRIAPPPKKNVHARIVLILQLGKALISSRPFPQGHTGQQLFTASGVPSAATRRWWLFPPHPYRRFNASYNTAPASLNCLLFFVRNRAGPGGDPFAFRYSICSYIPLVSEWPCLSWPAPVTLHGDS